MILPAYNLLVGAGVAIGFLVGGAALTEQPERNAWPYLCLLALGCGAVGAVGLSYYAGVTDSWQRPAFTFLGGASSGLVALVIASWFSGLNTLKVLDAAALAICTGHAIGRLGCYFGGCCYGKEINLAPTLDWSFRFPSPLIESVAEIAILLHLQHITKAFAGRSGLLAARWMLLYGLARFTLEYVRGDFRGAVPFNSGGMSPSQCVCIALVALGAAGHFVTPTRRLIPDSQLK